jgi:hypothetical protein
MRKEAFLAEFVILSRNLPVGTEGNDEKSQQNWCPCRDLNPELREY